MTEWHDHQPAPSIRVGDADRERAAQHLQAAVADGQLDLDELDERLAAVYSARTRVELAAVTADLPALHDADAKPLTLHTESGTLRKTGYWTVPSTIAITCYAGSIRVDFSEASCPHREVELTVDMHAGAVLIVVPPGWTVDMDEVTAFGGSVVNKVTQRPDPGAPVLRVRGRVRAGSFRVRYPRRTLRQWLSRS